MQKILFLDFDGVLNTENYQARLRSREGDGHHPGGCNEGHRNP